MRHLKSFQLDLDAWLLRLSGFVALLSIPFKELPYHADSFLPFDPDTTSHYISFFTGIGLIYMASQVARRKVASFYVAICGLVLLIAAELLYFRNPLQIALYSAALTNILKDRSRFVVKSDLVSLRRGTMIAGLMLIGVIAFSVVSFEVIDNLEFGESITTRQTISISLHSLAGEEIPRYLHPNRMDYLLIDLLRLAGILAVGIVTVSLFRPLQLRRKAPKRFRSSAQKLLETYGGSSEDFFKLWPEDKHYYFYKDSFLAYGLSGGIAIVLDGPNGNKKQFVRLRKAFIAYAEQNGWSVSLVHADDLEADAWRKMGFDSLFIGSEAMVSCETFINKTKRSKHFRYVSNKASRDQLEVSLWEPPLSEEQLHRLRTISDAWLSTDGRREYRFIMGYFDDSYLKKCQVAVLEREGKPVAYTNFIPSFDRLTASIDHMRSIPGTSGVAMHFLLMNAIELAADSGATKLNLGLAPLSQLDKKVNKNIAERILQTVKQLGRRYYSFEGLEQFKGKFEPEWQPRYLVYQGLPTRLIQIASSINSLTSYETNRRLLNRLLVIASAAAALAYASFPLAYFVNPPLLWHGLVSELGEGAYNGAWLFNTLDIVSSVIAFGVFLVIYKSYRPLNRLLRYALISALVSNLGNLIAAAVHLPDNFSAQNPGSLSYLVHHPAIIVHSLSSMVNSAGFLIALCLWSYAQYRRLGFDWRQILTIASLGLVTVGFLVGLLWHDAGALIQRSFIVCYAIWLIAFTRDLVRR